MFFSFKGVALQTKFVIQCSGWRSGGSLDPSIEESPLKYRFETTSGSNKQVGLGTTTFIDGYLLPGGGGGGMGGRVVAPSFGTDCEMDPGSVGCDKQK